MTDIVDRLRSPEVFISDGSMNSAVAHEAADEIERLREAVTLAANRLDRLSLEQPAGSERRYEVCEWTDQARAALGEDMT